MPIYTYSCSKCKVSTEAIRTINKRNDNFECPECGSKTERTLDHVHSTDQEFHTPVLSRSLAIPCPKQRAEMQRKFPDRKYLKDGRLVISSHNERKRILKQEGYIDHDGF